MSTFQQVALPNGLRVASERLESVESVAVAVSVGVGSRHESPAENGISHLLEHMAFKGTGRRSARQIAEEFDNIGGQFNAYTSTEQTVYYAKVLKDALPLAVDILADILQHSVFESEELKREEGVVLQEIAAHNDTPDDLIFDYFDEVAFPDQPLGRSILGTPERIAGYKRDDLFAYMKTHYQPPRMILSAAGNVSHDALSALANEHFGTLRGQDTSTPEPGRYGGGEKRVASDLEQLQLVMGFKGCTIHDDDFYTIQLYSSILGGGMSSRLFQEIREKHGMAYHVSSSVSAYGDCGLMSVYSATSEAQSAQLPLLVVDELKKMAGGVTDAELMRARNQQKAELLMARENPATVAGRIGKHLLTFGRYKTHEEIIERLEAVSLRDIHRIAEYILSCQKPALAALGPVTQLPSYDALLARLKN